MNSDASLQAVSVSISPSTKTENSFNYRWNNVNDNFIMPLDLLVNGSIKRVNPKNEFQSFKIEKFSQIEVMDWRFYVLPKKVN